MSTHRIKRLEGEIQQEVSSILLFEVTDPLVKGVTVTRVVVTKDLGIARVYYEVMGDKKEKEVLQRGLDRASGFVRRQLATRLSLRTIPSLEFFYDETKDAILRMDGLFAKL